MIFATSRPATRPRAAARFRADSARPRQAASWPRVTTWLALALAFACDAGEPPDPGAPPAAEDIDRAAALISAGDMGARIAWLSHDSLLGRATPSPGLESAARYTAAAFGSFGLQPAGDDGGFLQWYEIETGTESARAPNVVGVLRGRDPRLRDTYVVYSAHMDHIGRGPPDARGDSIYNGADDDASGTAAVIGIAQAFAALQRRPARSVLFLTVSGEEAGLLGSRAFLSRGVPAPSAIVANINIDMIGRNAPDTVVAIGLGYSDLGPRLLETAASDPDHGLAVIDDPWPEESFFLRSDHYNFAIRGIPAVFFFAGVHADYHRPSDEADRIDADKVARIARLAFRFGVAIAESAAAPAWTPEGLTAVGLRPQR